MQTSNGVKVLLINPPVPDKANWVREGRCQQMDIWGTPFPPLSLASIAGQIKSFSETLIIDSGPAKFNLEETLGKIKEYNPDVLILSTATPTIETDLNWFLPKVKELNPAIKTAAIGIHVTALPEETLKSFSFLDFVIRGEPELTAKELIMFLKDGKPRYENISGLAFREESGVVLNQPREFLADLDTLEIPFWQGIDFNNYRLPILNRPFNLITFARGCPFSCKFCNASTYYGKAIRKRSPARIIEEIELNIKNYGIRDFLFWTEFVTADSDYLRNVLSLLKVRQLDKKIRWVSNSRASGIDLSLFKEMKEAGCWQIAFGLEFGSNQILRLVQKGADALVEEHRKTIMAANAAGIVIDGHFIMGYPGEDEKTLQETINFALSLPLTFAHFYVATPFPGSQLYQEAVEKNWLQGTDWQMMSQDMPDLKTSRLAPKTIQEYVRKAYKKFYLRPKAVFKIMKIAHNPQEFFLLFQTGIKFVAGIWK